MVELSIVNLVQLTTVARWPHWATSFVYHTTGAWRSASHGPSAAAESCL